MPILAMRSEGGKVVLGWIVEWLKTFGKSDGLGIQGQARNESATVRRLRKLMVTGCHATIAAHWRLKNLASTYLPLPRAVITASPKVSAVC